MTFYQIEEPLAQAIAECRTKVRVRVAFDFTGTGEFVSIPDCDILELTVTSRKEAAGGTSTDALLVLENATSAYSPRLFDTYRPEYKKYNGLLQDGGLGNLRPGRKVEISYTTGRDNPFVKRFVLYVDDSGFQQTATGYSGRVCSVRLVDLSDKLKKTDRHKDWNNPEVLVHCTVCTKEFPESSLVHRIAGRSGLSVQDIDCSTISDYLPFVKLTRSVWDELSDIAFVYNAHLETAIEKPLVFVDSVDPVQYTFDSSNVTHIRSYDLVSRYRNTVRLKWTRYREFADRELWRYGDPPVLYDAALTPSYPFSANGCKRAIEEPGYIAPFRIDEGNGKTVPVVYAEDVDTEAMFATRISTNGSALRIVHYDGSSSRDHAEIQLAADSDTLLTAASIRGNAIAGEQNFCCYLCDDFEVAQRGTAAEHVTTPYLSDSMHGGKPYYLLFAEKLLAKLKHFRKGYFVTTNRPVFHARVGAAVRIQLGDGLETGRARIVRMELRYHERKAFTASFNLEEDET